MVSSVSEEVTSKKGGSCMIITGYASGMVECRWYNGFGVEWGALHEGELMVPEERRQLSQDA